MQMYPNSYKNKSDESVFYDRTDNEAVKTDLHLVEMLYSGISDEMRRAEEYTTLSEKIIDDEDKEAVRQMRMNCIGHIKLLEQVLFNVTGADSVPKKEYERENGGVAPHHSVTESLSVIMYEELDDVVFFRKLYISFLNIEIRDIMLEIITNKQSNGTKLMHIYTNHLFSRTAAKTIMKE